VIACPLTVRAMRFEVSFFVQEMQNITADAVIVTVMVFRNVDTDTADAFSFIDCSEPLIKSKFELPITPVNMIKSKFV